MARKETTPEQAAFAILRNQMIELKRLFPTLSAHAAKKAMAELHALVEDIEEARGHLDPIKDPGASFDPTEPNTAGRMVALALISQDRIPLGRIARTYGSGVYAIYYHGDHPAYAPVSGTETPLYVGKADPKNNDARTSREQGPQLYGRLADHRKMITVVGDYARQHQLQNPLRIEDFTCRRLVCATNAQLVAEYHLIQTFQPAWNSDTKICWGISKHGDSATMRSNKRSPWDVMHPGRMWAMPTSLDDKMSPELIISKLRAHFTENPPYEKRELIVKNLLSAFVQNAAMVSESESVAEEREAEQDGDLSTG